MEINLKRFVDIDIQSKVISSSTSERDTVVLLSSEGQSENNKIYSSLKEFNSDPNTSSLTKTKKYAEMYFSNGGLKLDVRYKIASNTDIVSEIKKLPYNEIVVAYCGTYSEMKTAATTITASKGSVGSINSTYGINQKILLGRTTSAEDCSGIDNFAVKVSAIEGSEMTIAAYLSRINIYGVNSIHDYAFTVESFSTQDLTNIVNDDTILGNTLDNNMNIDMELAGAIRNLGGNLTNGLDLVNQYTLIVLHQTITDRLLKLLTQKIKGQSGVNSIYTTIVDELSRYVTNGYLTTDKVWKDETKTLSYNNQTYTLIEKDQALVLGYHIVVLPLSALSEEDKAKRKCPPIYIFLADSYGIRNITINGEVI